MKKEGIVVEYDGYTCTIKDSSGVNYLLLKKEVIGYVEKSDQVIFNSEKVITTQGDRNIARFVKKLKRNC